MITFTLSFAVSPRRAGVDAAPAVMAGNRTGVRLFLIR
jgi:hypothetical protein